MFKIHLYLMDNDSDDSQIIRFEGDHIEVAITPSFSSFDDEEKINSICIKGKILDDDPKLKVKNIPEVSVTFRKSIHGGYIVDDRPLLTDIIKFLLNTTDEEAIKFVLGCVQTKMFDMSV